MEKPANQDVVAILLNVIRDYFSALRPAGDPDLTLEELTAEAEALLSGSESHDAINACLAATENLRQELQAMRILSGLGYGVLRPVFRNTDAIGSLMRRKLEPVSAPLSRLISRLQGHNSS